MALTPPLSIERFVGLASSSVTRMADPNDRRPFECATANGIPVG
jgi:hypothetical protein